MIKIIQKQAIVRLWQRVRFILTKYRDGWSLDNIETRRMRATEIRPLLPSDGWLLRTLDMNERWIDERILLNEWADI